MFCNNRHIVSFSNKLTMQPVTSSSKINYIANLRVLLTILVILHHTCITYGATGGWYYYDKTSDETATMFMTLFVAVNQSFFMGFFFFLSALFILYMCRTVDWFAC